MTSDEGEEEWKRRDLWAKRSYRKRQALILAMATPRYELAEKKADLTVTELTRRASRTLLRYLVTLTMVVGLSDSLNLASFDEKSFCFVVSFFSVSGSMRHYGDYAACVQMVNSVLVPLSYAVLVLGVAGKILLMSKVARTIFHSFS